MFAQLDLHTDPGDSNAIHSIDQTPTDEWPDTRRELFSMGYNGKFVTVGFWMASARNRWTYASARNARLVHTADQRTQPDWVLDCCP